MELFRKYVGTLKKSSYEEETQRERRRVRRQERFLSIQSDRENRNRQILFRDIHTISKFNTIAELDLIDSVDQALGWWHSMCDHTIERQLQCELALQKMKVHEVEYLKGALDRENKHSVVIFEADANRWEEARKLHLDAEIRAQKESIQDTINAVMQLTEQCISSFSANGLENDEGVSSLYVDTNIIAQLFLDNEIRPQECEDDVGVSLPCSMVSFSAAKAFKAIFQHENPFSISCPEFLQLLHFVFKEDCKENYDSRTFFDFSELPTIALNGPKLSGKSLLSNYIASHCGFYCVTDKDLVQKALDTFEKKSAAIPDCSPKAKKPPQTEEEWSSIGATLKELLLKGHSVPFTAIVQMVRLQLQDLNSQNPYDDDPKEVAGLLLDGIISSPDVYEELHNAFLPSKDLLYEPLIRCWCESLSAPDETQEAEAKNQIQNMLRIPKLLDEPPIQKESKEKVFRRSAGASTLPLPTLPMVDDISEEVQHEMTFIKKATAELSDYTSMLTAIIQIECDPEELFRRFAGLRIDQENGAEYHMVYCPPPPNRAPFLIPLERTQANTVHLADIILHQQEKWMKMRRWLSMQSQPNLMSKVYELNGEQPIEAIQGVMDGILSRINENFIAARNLFRSMKASRDRVAALKDTHAQQTAEREAKRQHLIGLYSEKGAPLPTELQAVSLPNECETSDPLRLPRGVCRVVLKATHSFTLRYIGTYDTAWGCLRSLAMQVTQYRAIALGEMQRFMRFPDDKQRILDNFIKHFNGVRALMRSEISFKEEAHAMVEELADNLFRYVSTTKKKWQQLICAIIRRDSFMESWESSLRNVGMTLAQAEAERFVMVVRLFAFFFNSQIGDELITIEELDWETAFASINTAENLECSVRIEKKRMPNVKKQHPTSTSTHAYGKCTDDGSTRSARDAFDELLQRIVAVLTSFVDRFRTTSDTSLKVQKKTTTAGTVREETIISHFTPFVEAEISRTLERLYCIRDFVGNMASQAEQYRAKMRDKMLEDMTEAVHAEASAVNSALYILRCCIEEENKAPRMHLGCGTFAVLDPSGQSIVDPSQTNQPKASHKSPSFITDVPLYQGTLENTLDVHPGLSFGRLGYLIMSFATVAPQYQLSKSDFMRFVREEDYSSISSNTTSPSSSGTSRRRLKSTLMLFHAFDVNQAGVIDWREFIMHLLFWCKPPTAKNVAGVFVIPDATIEQLRNSKQVLGDVPLDEKDFSEKTLYFAQYLPQNRLEAYMEALWLTFKNKQTQTLDPLTLLLFLCADVQLIRGAQKAICVSAQMPGETHNLAVTQSELERIFHVLSTNPRELGLHDPFSARNIELLFASQAGAPEAISFRQMCECLMGRMMLNGSSAFHCKSFIA
ncbi:unnamed protein product [Phytomonas sp. Hart1]|nr:unnamed protein product [Phytomonas sp. Hart1]|eukprot:CCW70089.1 unnamed protein product [Phytomonas sp. isolate Hart1]